MADVAKRTKDTRKQAAKRAKVARKNAAKRAKAARKGGRKAVAKAPARSKTLAGVAFAGLVALIVARLTKRGGGPADWQTPQTGPAATTPAGPAGGDVGTAGQTGLSVDSTTTETERTRLAEVSDKPS